MYLRIMKCRITNKCMLCDNHLKFFKISNLFNLSLPEESYVQMGQPHYIRYIRFYYYH